MSRSLSSSQRVDFSSSKCQSQQVNDSLSRMIGSLRSDQSSYSNEMIEANDDDEDDMSTGIRTSKTKPKSFNLDGSENERDKVIDLFSKTSSVNSFCFIYKISFSLQNLFCFKGCTLLGIEVVVRSVLQNRCSQNFLLSAILLKKRTPAHVFSCEFHEVFKNSVFI